MVYKIHMTIFAMIFALASSGCATGKSPGRAIADTLLPISQENELGKQMSAEVEKELTLSNDEEINKWIRGLGMEVVAAARDRGDIPDGINFTFKVVEDDDTINAFALPGGYIYMYTGLLKAASNEAEIVGVLGHEVAHVTKRHIAKRLVAAYGASAIASIALGKNPGLLGELVAGVLANGYLLKHSRDAERESDAVGIWYTVDAGYTPIGYVSFFTKLAESPSPPALISSHPNPAERVANARKAIAKMRKAQINQKDGAEKYREMAPKI